MAYTMEQAVKAGLAFNPLSSPDGQGEIFEGKNQNRLLMAMEAYGWKDFRFLSKEQVDRAGWRLADDAQAVQVTFRDASANTWSNKVLFNAAQIEGIPPLEAMLAVARARLQPVRGVENGAGDVEQAAQAVVGGAAVREQVAQIEALEKEEAAQAVGVEAGIDREEDEEETLVVGPARKELVQEDTVSITPVVRDKALDGPHGTSADVDHVVTTLLNTLYKEREPGCGEYVRGHEKKVAFVDQGGALVIKDKAPDTYRAAMELAKSKGWTEIELSGKPANVAKGWLEAQLIGVTVTNYAPTAKDLEALEKRRVEQRELDHVAETIAAWNGKAGPHGVEVPASGIHVGPVVDVKDGFAIQKTGPNKYAAHRLADFREAPKVGEPLEVEYRNGKFLRSESQRGGKDTGVGREIGGR